MDIDFFNTNCHLVPPLRSLHDRDALSRGLIDGTIDAICSDHAPVDEDAKLLPFGQAEVGAMGLELLLSLTFKWATSMNIPLIEALNTVTLAPARILGIDAGHLTLDAPADICIFDPEEYWHVSAATIKSQGKNTPFLGRELPGRVKFTLTDGNIVYES